MGSALRRLIVLAGIVTAVVLLVPASARPTGGTFMYPSTACPKGATGLNDCIAAASDGATIKVKPGVYFESAIVVGHSVTIAGACGRPSPSVIDMGDNEDGFDIEAANVKVSCLTLRHGGNTYAGIDNSTTHGGPFAGLGVSGVTFLGDAYGIFQNDGAAAGLSVTKSTFVGGNYDAIYVGTGTTDATISGNTFSNVSEHCIYASTGLTGTTISANTFNVCGSSAVYVSSGDSNTVSANKAKTINDTCFDIYSTNSTFTKNVTSGCNGGGVDLTADGATITNNLFTGQLNGTVMNVGCGDNAVISGNKATSGTSISDFIFVCQSSGAGSETITNNTATVGLVNNGIKCVPCDNATVTGNKMATGGDADGVYVRGLTPVVNGNLVGGGWNGYGVHVECTGACGSGQVEKNKESDSNSSNGFQVASTGCASFPCMTISGNSALGNYEDGFHLSTPFAQVTSNTSRENGVTVAACGSGNSGFELAGASMQLSKNTADENGCDGFYVAGASNILTSNTAMGNVGMGFQVTLDGNTLNLNAASKNHADGINNDGTNTVFTSNKSAGNRQDCTNDDQAPSAESATIATNTGNKCADGQVFDWASTLSSW